MTHQYHDAIDRREARERAEQAERELDEQDEKCCCFEIAGDNPHCPIHGEDAEHEAQAREYREQQRDIADLRGGL